MSSRITSRLGAALLATCAGALPALAQDAYPSRADRAGRPVPARRRRRHRRAPGGRRDGPRPRRAGRRREQGRRRRRHRHELRREGEARRLHGAARAVVDLDPARRRTRSRDARRCTSSRSSSRSRASPPTRRCSPCARTARGRRSPSSSPTRRSGPARSPTARRATTARCTCRWRCSPRAPGLKLLHVPFTGAGPAVVALLGGQIDAVSSGPSTVVQHVKAGKLRVLASWGDKRLASLPDVPTLTESGYPVVFTQWTALFAPAGTPDAAHRQAARRRARDRRRPEVRRRDGDRRDADPVPRRARAPALLGRRQAEARRSRAPRRQGRIRPRAVHVRTWGGNAVCPPKKTPRRLPCRGEAVSSRRRLKIQGPATKSTASTARRSQTNLRTAD